ncbi:MAG: GTP-binding protein, partial [Promethearchaeota archaeon]
MEKERSNGNREYKERLIALTSERLENLASQMKFRLYEGQGEAFFLLGVSDEGQFKGLSPDEMKKSLVNLSAIAEEINAKVRILRIRDGIDGHVAEVLICQEKDSDELPIDVRIASVGNVDTGKSTVLGVLMTGEPDDGNGLARNVVFRHLHEFESGRTSSVSIKSIGFTIEGEIINQNPIKRPTDSELLELSHKTLTFLDLAGHERYLKTTIFGLTGLQPDYALLVVAANQGILPMTREHLGLALALRIPLFVVITKIDLAPEPKKKQTLHDLLNLLKLPGIALVPFVIKDEDDAIIAARTLLARKVAPIFQVSAVTMKGFDIFQSFLSLLRPTQEEEFDPQEDFHAFIDDVFSVPGVGTVVAGTILSGEIHKNDSVFLGPTDTGQYLPTKVRSMHYKRVFTNHSIAGHSVTFALQGIHRDEVRKGMILVKEINGRLAVRRFAANVFILYHSTTIRPGYSPVIHCKSIQQAARVVRMSKDIVRTGDRCSMEFE